MSLLAVWSFLVPGTVSVSVSLKQNPRETNRIYRLARLLAYCVAICGVNMTTSMLSSTYPHQCTDDEFAGQNVTVAQLSRNDVCTVTCILRFGPFRQDHELLVVSAGMSLQPNHDMENSFADRLRRMELLFHYLWSQVCSGWPSQSGSVCPLFLSLFDS